MDWQAALIAGIALPAAAAAVGFAWRARTGRVCEVRRAATVTDAAAPVDRRPEASGAEAPATAAALELDAGALGDRATLVQFSTEYCSRCPSTARQLTAVAGDYNGVRHVEIDLTHRADLAARFGVLQTPTTLILGADGTPTARIGGVPRLGAVRRHLDTLTGSASVTS